MPGFATPRGDDALRGHYSSAEKSHAEKNVC
jgi:hypothetical protein